MKNSPRAGKQYHNRVPIAEAAEIVGGLDALRSLAGNDNTWKTWKDRWKAVPASRVVPAALERIRDRQLGATPPRLSRPMRDLLAAFQPGMTYEPLAALKPGALKEYEARVHEIEAELQDFAKKKLRELGELRDALMTRFK